MSESLRYTLLATRDLYVKIVDVIEEIDYDLALNPPENNLGRITRVSLIKKIRPLLPSAGSCWPDSQRMNFVTFLPERIDVVANWYGWNKTNEKGRVIYYVGLPN